VKAVRPHRATSEQHIERIPEVVEIKLPLLEQALVNVWKAFCSCFLGSFDFDLRPGPVIPELAGQICDMLRRVSRVTAHLCIRPPSFRDEACDMRCSV
jgi:hypothetical protein